MTKREIKYTCVETINNAVVQAHYYSFGSLQMPIVLARGVGNFNDWSFTAFVDIKINFEVCRFVRKVDLAPHFPLSLHERSIQFFFCKKLGESSTINKPSGGVLSRNICAKTPSILWFVKEANPGGI